MTDVDRGQPAPRSAATDRAIRHRGRYETVLPGARTRLSARRRLLAYVLAVVLPVVVAVAMIPVRVDHGRAAVLALVLPVVLVALLGATGPAVVAAATSVLAYDLLLVEPYYSFAIEDTDEVVAAATLLVVALVVGVLNARLVRLHARDTARRDELRHLIAFVRAVASIDDQAELTDTASEHLTAVLNLQRCVWQPGPAGSTRPVLMADGNVMGLQSDLNPDRALLPEHLEVPVWRNGTEIGRFLLTPTERHVASYEERVTAAAIAELYGQAADALAHGAARQP